MTCKRLRLAAAVLVGLALLAAPAARALPGRSDLEARAVTAREAPHLFAGLWNLFARLFLDLGLKNRASIDPNGAEAVPDNRISIDPNG